MLYPQSIRRRHLLSVSHEFDCKVPGLYIIQYYITTLHSSINVSASTSSRFRTTHDVEMVVTDSGIATGCL
jgi:hypothetical protein